MVVAVSHLGAISPSYQEGDYLHQCTRNSDRLIDETCDEFIHCRCFQPTAEVLALQDKLIIALDAKRKLQ